MVSIQVLVMLVFFVSPCIREKTKFVLGSLAEKNRVDIKKIGNRNQKRTIFINGT